MTLCVGNVFKINIHLKIERMNYWRWNRFVMCVLPCGAEATCIFMAAAREF